MRTLLAWIVALAILFLVGTPFQKLGEALEFDQYHNADFSFFSSLLAGFLALLAWGKIGDGVVGTKRDVASFLCAAFFLSTMTIMSLVLGLAFRDFHSASANYVHLALTLLIALGVFWGCRLWWKNREARHPDETFL